MRHLTLNVLLHILHVHGLGKFFTYSFKVKKNQILMSTDIPLRFIGLSPVSLVVGQQVDKAIKPNTDFGYKSLFC